MNVLFSLRLVYRYRRVVDYWKYIVVSYIFSTYALMRSLTNLQKMKMCNIDFSYYLVLISYCSSMWILSYGINFVIYITYIDMFFMVLLPIFIRELPKYSRVYFRYYCTIFCINKHISRNVSENKVETLHKIHYKSYVELCPHFETYQVCGSQWISLITLRNNNYVTR